MIRHEMYEWVITLFNSRVVFMGHVVDLRIKSPDIISLVH